MGGGGEMGAMPQGGMGGVTGNLPQGLDQGYAGTPMSSGPMQGPGMMGAGMGGMGFGGGQPGQGFGPGVDNFAPQQGGYPQLNMDQISGLLRGMQGAQNAQQGMPQQNLPPQLQQMQLPPQQMQQPMTRSAERAWYNPAQQGQPAPSMPAPDQQRHGFFGVQQAAPQESAGISALPQQNRSQAASDALAGYNRLMAARRGR